MSRIIEKKTAHRLLFILGFVFLGAGLVLDVGQPGDYWYSIFRETYQGYDIYYLPGPGGLYGVTEGGVEPTLGGGNYIMFSDALDKCRAAIDNWILPPLFVEPYLRWNIYREPALAQRYYGVDIMTGEESSMWNDLEPLKDYLYGIYYGTLEGFWTITTGDTVYSSDQAPLPEGMLFPVNSATFTYTITAGVVEDGYVTIDGELTQHLSEVDVVTWSVTVTGITQGDHLLTLWAMNAEIQSCVETSISVTGPSFNVTFTYMGIGTFALAAVLELNHRQKRR